MVSTMLTADRKIAMTPADAIAAFLVDMEAAAKSSFPLWQERLTTGVTDAFAPDREAAQALLDRRPIEDLYLAGVIGMEAARIRRNLEPDCANALLAELAGQVDWRSRRPDRLMSDFVFFVMGRIDLEAGVELMRMPHDLVVSMLLDKIGLNADEHTRPLLADVVFRHNLGEPLARGVPQWWTIFASRFSITVHGKNAPAEIARSA